MALALLGHEYICGCKHFGRILPVSRNLLACSVDTQGSPPTEDDGREFYSEFERSTTTIRNKLQTNFSRPFPILLTQPIVQVVSILAAYNFGVNYIMLSTFSELWTG